MAYGGFVSGECGELNRRKMIAMAAAAIAAPLAPIAPVAGFASGGIIRSGRSYLIGSHANHYYITGERGPEFFMPHKPGFAPATITVYPKPKLG